MPTEFKGAVLGIVGSSGLLYCAGCWGISHKGDITQHPHAVRCPPHSEESCDFCFKRLDDK